MADRRRAGVWAAGILGVLGAVAGMAWMSRPARRVGTPAPSPAPAVSADGPLGRGDARALAALARRVAIEPGKPVPPFSEAQAAEAVEALKGLRAGYAKFGPEGRASALAVTGQVLAHIAADPGPACWHRTLEPSHAVLALGMADADPGVRASALAEVGRLWSWAPGRSLLEAEELAVESWKDGFIAPARRHLADREPAPRAAAVACLARLPVNEEAASAAAYVADPDAGVRQQALVGFAARRNLLAEEAILPLLYDPSPAVALIAEQVLKARGLTQDQIGLGRLVAHPSADLRASAIPLLLPRTDIDPDVWLLHLSRDRDESVRSQAVEALAGRPSPEARQRLREMARSDTSAQIRAAASKALPANAAESTVALPPLPGSPNLNPRAN